MKVDDRKLEVVTMTVTPKKPRNRNQLAFYYLKLFFFFCCRKIVTFSAVVSFSLFAAHSAIPRYFFGNIVQVCFVDCFLPCSGCSTLKLNFFCFHFYPVVPRGSLFARTPAVKIVYYAIHSRRKKKQQNLQLPAVGMKFLFALVKVNGPSPAELNKNRRWTWPSNHYDGQKRRKSQTVGNTNWLELNICFLWMDHCRLVALTPNYKFINFNSLARWIFRLS